MLNIDKEITKIENRYYDEVWDCIHTRYVNGKEFHKLLDEVYDLLEEKRENKQIKEYSIKVVDMVDTGVYSIVCIGNNNELYHRLIKYCTP